MAGPPRRNNAARYYPALLIIVGALGLLFYGLTVVRGRSRQYFDYLQEVKGQQCHQLATILEAAATGGPGGTLLPENLSDLLRTVARNSDVATLALIDSEGQIVAHSSPGKVGTRFLAPFDLDSVLLQNETFFTFETRGEGTIASYARRFRFLDYEQANQQPPPYGDRLVVYLEVRAEELIAIRDFDFENLVYLTSVGALLAVAGLYFSSVLGWYFTARRRQEWLQNYLGILLDSLSSAVISLDRDNAIVEMNRLARDLFANDGADLKGQRLDALLGAGNERLCRRIETSLRIRQENVDLRRGEETIPVGLRVHEVLSPEEEAEGKVVIFEDEREIAHLKNQVQRSERLASLGRIASMIAHEVRNPLNTIKGHVSLLRDQLEEHLDESGPSTWRDVVDRILSEVERLNRVVGELVHFASPVNLELASTDINAVVHETLEFMRSDAELQGIRIEEILDTDLPVIDFDEGRLKQVLLNIYLNAFDAMDNGGTLTVTTTNQPFRNRWTIAIEDTGHGIPEEDLPHLFDPYFTTKKKGAGLGLSIVHNTIENLNGTIQVSSTEGQGTKFTLTFTMK